ncbi:TRAP transporter substrate-binding protein [Uliginosibacterium gangwonense]|uniref:TRAP transporter substrate-binding protein n=1 Tax=Uliginosibacterium gangwonense TaxID=392736 RepID=UPI00039F4EC3|nr:TRAP transporter substrate-binding protein DctP [Uliginosibacterium gangwonense]
MCNMKIAFCVCAVIMTAGASPASMGATTLVSSDQQEASHPVVRAVEQFGQIVSQRTQGELNVVVKPGGALGSETDVLRNVRDGRQAMARVNLGLLGDLMPSAELASLPYLFRSSEHLHKILDGDFGRRIDAELAGLGLVRIMYLESSSRNFYCRRPIRTQADFKGLKVRVLSSKVLEDVIQNLGATPVSMPFNSVGDALKNGQIDCADGGTVNYMSSGHNKFAPYLMTDEHLLMPDVLLISKKIWDKLPQAQRTILLAAGKESSEYMRKLWHDQEAAALAATKKAGVTVIGRQQMAMTAIEAQAVKSYTKYVRNTKDLEMIMKIVTTK